MSAQDPVVDYRTFLNFKARLVTMIADAEDEKLSIEDVIWQVEDDDELGILNLDLASATDAEYELTYAALALEHDDVTEEDARILNNAAWAMKFSDNFRHSSRPAELDTTGVYHQFDPAFSFDKPTSHRNRDEEVGPKGESVGEEPPPGGHLRVDSGVGQSDDQPTQAGSSVVFRSTEHRPDGTIIENREVIWYSHSTENEPASDVSPWYQSHTETSDGSTWQQSWF